MNTSEECSTHTRLKASISFQELEAAEPETQTSDFGESACGEALSSQHLVVDFTPNDDDNEYVQQKCCAFWEFVNTCPELQNCMVLPEGDISDRKSRLSDIEMAPSISKTVIKQTEHVKTAVSMLEFVEEKGLISKAFEAKLPQSSCSIRSPDYFEEKQIPHRIEKGEAIGDIDVEKGIVAVCSCKKVCKSCKAKTLQEKRQRHSINTVKRMCKELQDWDMQHPKSLDPPGHPPNLAEV